MRASVSLLCAALMIFISVAAFAQSDVGTIVGFVKDQSGAVVPNAKVTIQNEGTGELHTVSTDEEGRYTAPSLPPAYYSMTAEGLRNLPAAITNWTPTARSPLTPMSRSARRRKPSK